MTPEIMDSPALEEGEHRRALEGLRRLNESAGAGRAMAGALLEWIQRTGRKKVSILDVACGGGDVPSVFGRRLHEAGVEVELVLLDRSAVAVEQAGETARVAGLTYETRVGDVVAELPLGAADVVTNSLFLHHLTEEEVVRALGNMKRAARHGVVVSDLRRSWGGYWLAVAACRMLTRSRVVHFDGPVSVKAAWTMAELKRMAERAGLRGAKVVKQFPFRMMLIYFPGDGGNDGM